MTTFPIAPPTVPRFGGVTFGIDRVVAATQSPFTLEETTFLHPGAAWSGSVSLPPMSAVQAAAWSAFLARLAGRDGTFTLNPPDRAAPFGTQTADFTVASAAAARATSISVTMVASATLLAGDRYSIADELHEVVVDATADGAGAATLEFEPPLRAALVGSETVKVSPPRGVFRMLVNDLRPDRNRDGTYSLGFGFREAF